MCVIVKGTSAQNRPTNLQVVITVCTFFMSSPCTYPDLRQNVVNVNKKKLFSLYVVFFSLCFFFFTKYKKHASQIIGNATRRYRLENIHNPNRL